MKLLRHLLSYLLLVLVIFGIVTLYYFRHHVLPVNYAQKVDSYAGKIHPALVTFASTNASTKDIVLDKGVVVETKSDSKQNENKTETETETTVAVEKTIPDAVTNEGAEEKQDVVVVDETTSVTGETAHVTDDASALTGETTPVNDKPLVIEMNNKEPSNEGSAQGSNASTSVKADEVMEQNEDDSPNLSSSTDKEYASSAALLKVARIAYQEGNPHVAIKIYKELIELENDEADFYGELGNVYYAIGNWDEAGLAYYEAATRLIEQNKFAQVGYLQRVIQGLNAEQAEKLAEQLSRINQ